MALFVLEKDIYQAVDVSHKASVKSIVLCSPITGGITAQISPPCWEEGENQQGGQYRADATDARCNPATQGTEQGHEKRNTSHLA